MEEFTVKCSVLKRSKLEMEKLEDRMKNCAEDIGRIRKNLRGKISSEEQIGKRLEKLEARFEAHAKELMSFGELAYSIGERYLLAEKIILGENIDWKSLDVKGLKSDIIGELGVAGSLITGGVSLDTAKDIIDNLEERASIAEWFGVERSDFEKEDTILKSFKKGVKEGIDETLDGFRETERWRNNSEFLNHLDRNLRTAYENALQHGDDTTFIKELFKNTKDAAVDSGRYIRKADISQILGIGGAAVSVISTGTDNFEEYRQGEISLGRALAETGGEIAVDWALDIGLTAAAMAVLPAGAPAIAVGAAVVGAGWLLDEVTQWVTKDADASFVEVASDAVLDFAGSAVEGIQNVNEAIGNGIQSAGNAVCDWWGSLW